MARQHQNFCDIREIGGAELTNDIYVREPGNQIFWFAGKVARVSGTCVCETLRLCTCGSNSQSPVDWAHILHGTNVP